MRQLERADGERHDNADAPQVLRTLTSSETEIDFVRDSDFVRDLALQVSFSQRKRAQTR
jgi:hypothetical protein